MKASEARSLTTTAIDESLTSIFATIKAATKKGRFETSVGCDELNDTQIDRLKGFGYSIDGKRYTEVITISW